MLVNNASSLGPTPLALLGDTACGDFERTLVTNVLGPFRLTKALLGALSASARERRGAVVLNVSSDAAMNPYQVGALTAPSRGRTASPEPHLEQGGGGRGCAAAVARSGDMDTPLHALAVRTRSGDAQSGPPSRRTARRCHRGGAAAKGVAAARP